MRLARSFLTNILLLASASATALEAHADDIEETGSGRVITLTRTNYHTVCPCTTALLANPTTTSPLQSNQGQPDESTNTSGDDSSSDPGSSGSGQEYATSTVFTSHVHTVTACPSSAKSCPSSEKTTYVTTETVIDYTTICPITASASRTGSSTKIVENGSTPGQTLTRAGGEKYTTSTVYATRTSTITACPSSIKNCPASERSTYVTTETIIDYTTVCPITASSTSSGFGPTSTGFTSNGHTSGSISASVSGHEGHGHGHGHGHGSGSVSSSVSDHEGHGGHGHGHSHGHGSGSTTSSSISHTSSPRPSSTSLRTSTSGTLISPSFSVQRASSTLVIKTSASATPSATTEPLALYVEPVQQRRKRQTYNTAVLISAGSITASCTNADRFYLVNGHLFDGNLLVSADNNASSTSFVGTSSPGPIRGAFTITGGVLSWSNSNFSNGAASFCVSGTTVLAIFSGDTPSGCAPVTIAAVKYSQMCPGGAATTSSGAISSATPSSTVIPKCSAKSDPELSTTVLPALDPSVDGSSLLNLSPSMYATLYYANPTRSTILQVTYYMLYPQVTLENAYNIATVTCSGSILTVKATTAAAFTIANQWPTKNFILITNSGSCNSASQRGVYMVNSYVTDAASLTITLNVSPKVWADVSNTMEVAYGIGRVNSTSISYTPSCTASHVTASSTPTSSNSSVLYEDLTPEEKNVVAYLIRNNTYDANGNIAVTVPAVIANTTNPVFNPDSNSTQQAALEDALQNAGLPSPDSMWNQTASDIAGHCSNGVYVPPTTVYTKRTPRFPSRPYHANSHNRFHRAMLAKRSGLEDETWWKWLWEIGCNDITKEVLEAFDEELGAIAELICTLKELYDTVEEAYAQRDAIKCAFTGCYMNVVVATYWNYTYTASVDYEIPAQPLVRSSVGTLSCVDCSLSISNLQLVGSVMIATSTGKVMSAFMTPTMSWDGKLVMGLETTDAWSGNWTYTFDTINFNPTISVPGEFTITPSLLYGLGVQWSTTAAVDFTAGADISVNSASFYLDFYNNAASQVANWSPTVKYTYPVLSTSAKVSFVPIMRTSLAIAVSIENAPYGQQPVYINSDTAIGFNAGLVLDDGERCSAGELELTSYSSVNNKVHFTGGSTTVLSQSGDVAGETKCFNVPNDIPTVDEVNSLRSVGGDFCTSYIGYVPPTSVAYGVTTRTGPTTMQTTMPTTISTTSTVYEYPTVTTVITQTTTVDRTSYMTVSGSQSLGNSYMKKRALKTGSPLKRSTDNGNDNITPQPTKAADHAKRTVSEPAMIATWDSSKISLACSQVATGTVTKTFYTSTATAYSGTVVNTAYSTVNALGTMETSTFSRIVVSQTVTTVTGTQPATATTATSCPLQTQVSCFTITASGPQHVTGKQLYLSNNSSSPVWGGWGTGYEVGVFYLTCAGDLVALPSMNVLAPAQDKWVEFDSFSSATSKQSCSKDSSSGILSCGSGWYATSPVALRYTDFRAYSGDWQPVWNDGTSEDTLTPVVLTYETVDCPCQY